MPAPSAKPDYGIDAPGLVRTFVLIGAVSASLAIAAGFSLVSWHPWGSIVTVLLATVAVYALGMFTLMTYWSRVTKVREREQFLDLVAWRGDEAVLDVGCGRGLMLVGAAERLSSGRAVGIDIWEASDQSANTPDAALHNAALEGVGDRVSVHTADMRNLPFENASFDVIVSHWAVHNLGTVADRDTALAEMVRVLRSDGTIILVDIENRDRYMAHLATLGLGSQELFVAVLRDKLLAAVSFGSFRPAAIVARRGRL